LGAVILYNKKIKNKNILLIDDDDDDDDD